MTAKLASDRAQLLESNRSENMDKRQVKRRMSVAGVMEKRRMMMVVMVVVVVITSLQGGTLGVIEALAPISLAFGHQQQTNENAPAHSPTARLACIKGDIEIIG